MHPFQISEWEKVSDGWLMSTAPWPGQGPYGQGAAPQVAWPAAPRIVRMGALLRCCFWVMMRWFVGVHTE